MLNFKQVLLGEDRNINVENTEWPELGSISHGNSTWRNSSSGRIQNIAASNDSVTNSSISLSQPSTSTSYDFPRLGDSLNTQLSKRGKECPSRLPNKGMEKSVESCDHKVEKSKHHCWVCKKYKTRPEPNLTVDINVMLKISLSLAEKRRKNKRMKHSGTYSKALQLAAKNLVCGNKLDSDSPKMHKGKKRPFKRRRETKIKRGFHCAAAKKTKRLPASFNFTKRMHQLRQIILSKMAMEQDIEELVTNLGRISVDDVNNEEKTVENDSSIDVLQTTAKSIIHSKYFRPYCNHLLKTSLKDKSIALITTLRNFQDKMYHRDPIKSKAKRRYVCGCHEVRKFLKINAVKLLFIANNVVIKNGLPLIMQELIQMAEKLELPVVYSGSLFDLGYWTLKKRKTTAIAILNYDGAENLYKEVLSQLNIAKHEYQLVLESVLLNLQMNFKNNITNLNKES